MDKHKYRFHDPNPRDKTADRLLKLFAGAGRDKARQAVRRAAREVGAK